MINVAMFMSRLRSIVCTQTFEYHVDIGRRKFQAAATEIQLPEVRSTSRSIRIQVAASLDQQQNLRRIHRFKDGTVAASNSYFSTSTSREGGTKLSQRTPKPAETHHQSGE